jgi:hypothetical protein
MHASPSVDINRGKWKRYPACLRLTGSCDRLVRSAVPTVLLLGTFLADPLGVPEPGLPGVAERLSITHPSRLVRYREATARPPTARVEDPGLNSTWSLATAAGVVLKISEL